MVRLKAGAKGELTAEPLDFSSYPLDRAGRRVRFIEDFLMVPKGVGAREPVQLRDFQRVFIESAFAEGIRTGLLSIPRANGKSALGAMLAVAELFVNDESPEVLVVASDQRQATIIARMARRMIELNPELEARSHRFADGRITVPDTDGLLLPLPADPGALHGHDPSLLIVDELHVVTEATWEAVSSVTGKRPESLTLAISTPASSPDSIMWSLVEHGRAGDDAAFTFTEYAAPEGCAVDDREAWRIANPALSCDRPFLSEDGLLAAMRTIREPVFRQLRLGQWVTGSEAWLPFGAWDDCEAARTVDARTRVVLAFDGSASGDSTALVGCTVGPDPHIWIEGMWENPNERGWRVPRDDVDNAVAVAFDRYNVVELACDPWGWRSEIETWSKRHGERRVLEWNTAAANRMAPATDRLYQAVVTQGLSHDGDPRLAAHMAHCIAKRTPMGDLVSKDKKNSPRKIDAAVASIVALDRAAFHSQKSGSRVAATRRY